MTGLLVIALVAAVVATRAVVVVPAEHAFVVERLGRFRTVLAPGFHVKQHLQPASAAWGIEVRGGEIAK